jgi:hypothetical protein
MILVIDTTINLNFVFIAGLLLFLGYVLYIAFKPKTMKDKDVNEYVENVRSEEYTTEWYEEIGEGSTIPIPEHLKKDIETYNDKDYEDFEEYLDSILPKN